MRLAHSLFTVRYVVCFIENIAVLLREKCLFVDGWVWMGLDGLS